MAAALRYHNLPLASPNGCLVKLALINGLWASDAASHKVEALLNWQATIWAN